MWTAGLHTGPSKNVGGGGICPVAYYYRKPTGTCNLVGMRIIQYYVAPL